MTSKRISIIVLALLPGCGLTPVEEGEEGGDGDIPPAVQAAFDGSCATTVSCHANGNPILVNLGEGLSAAILDIDAANGMPYVDLGNVDNSYIAAKILGNDITGSPMPPSPQSDNDGVNKAIIVGWIAGVDPGDEAFEAGPTCYGPGIEPVAGFADIWPILEARCSLPGCHQDDTDLLMMDSAGALTNLTTGMTAAGDPYVTPMDAEGSWMWRKLTGTQGAGNGVQMPASGELCTDDLIAIFEWIDGGALP